nr:hypothetical protein [Tanacetum cinerariifolium]
MQTQTSNTLHNAIMEDDGKDCPPMLAPGSYVTTTEMYMENYKNVSQDICDQLNAEAEADGESLESYYSRFYKMINERIRNQRDVTNPQVNVQFFLQLQPEWQRNRGKAIVNSPSPIYDQEPSMVAEDDETSKDKANQDNSSRINKGAGYDNKRLGNVVGARETVEVTPDATENSGPIFDTEPLEKQEEAGIQLNAEQADWRDDTDDESDDQELEAHYMYMAKLQEKLSAHQETISILSQAKEAQIKLYKTREDKDLDKVIDLENKVKVLDNIVYKTGQSVQTMNMLNSKCRTSFAKPEFLKKAQRANPRLYDIGCYNDNLALMLAPESDEVIRLEKEIRSKLSDLIRPFDYEKLNNLYDLFHNVKSQKRMDESIPWDQKCKSSKELFKIKRSVGMIFDGVERCKESVAKRTYFGHIDPFIQNTIEANFCPEIQKINADLEKFHLYLNEEMVADLRYFNSLELEVDSLRSQLKTQKTQFLNEIDRLSREYYYADHMNAILGVYIELDEVTNLQCDYLKTLEKCECLEKELSKSKIMSKSFEALQKHASKDFCKEHEQYFEIQDLKAQLQDKGIAISELKKLIEKLKRKYVDTKFKKSSVIRQPNAFKSQRPSILGKPTIFSDSLERKDFSKSKSVSKNNVSNDFSKPVTAQILPPNKTSMSKNTNVLSPGMYKLQTEPTQTRTTQLQNDVRKTNKRVSFSTRVIPHTSVSSPQLKSNRMEDRVMLNNSQGKKKEVEDNHRNAKFSKNKTFVRCNDSLNAKTSNVNFVCASCGKYVFNAKNDMCVIHSCNGVQSRNKMPMAVPVSTREPKRNVNKSGAKPLKITDALESTNQKPRHTTRKRYEHVSKAYSWWYPKFTPPGYKWKPKSQKPLSFQSFQSQSFNNKTVDYIIPHHHQKPLMSYKESSNGEIVRNMSMLVKSTS